VTTFQWTETEVEFTAKTRAMDYCRGDRPFAPTSKLILCVLCASAVSLLKGSRKPRKLQSE